MSKTVKCPFCDKSGDKEKIINHIERSHMDMVPEGMYPAQMLYDATHKEYGKCVVCKGETKWNPKTDKYNRLCGKPQCKRELREKFKRNMINVYGKTTLLDDADHQAKMLSHRSISGEYTYSDGTKFTYTGSYELNAIKFMDEFLHLDSQDILMPGPVINYHDASGEVRKWITDIYYIPYNLIIEVKDGGSNPNNRQMDVYRSKQIAKEKELIKLGEYNYLRLTDNNFVQLIEVLALLKYQEIEPAKMDGKIIRINESADETDDEPTEDLEVSVDVDIEIKDPACECEEDEKPTDVDYVMLHKRVADMKRFFGKIKNDNTLTEFVGVAGVGAPVQGLASGNMILQYSAHPDSFKDRKDSFGFVVDKKETKERVSMDNEDSQIVDRAGEFKQDFEKSYYKYKKKPVQKEGANTWYEYISGKKLLCEDQILYDDDFEHLDLYRVDKHGLYDMVKTIKDNILRRHYGDVYDYMPLYDLYDINTSRIKLKEFSESDIILEDQDGYFVMDPARQIRSRSYKSILEIDAASYQKTKDSIDEDPSRDVNNKKVAEINDGGMYKVLDDGYDSLAQLDDDYAEYQELPMDVKKASDDMSISIFGKTNGERYKELKAKYLNSAIPSRDIPLTEELSLLDIEHAKDFGISLEDKEREIDMIRYWSFSTGIYCVLPCETEEELDAQWEKFNTMHHSLMAESDNKMMEYFGCNNETMYNFLSSKFNNAMDDDFYHFALVESSVDDFYVPSDMPFFLPYEIRAFKEANTYYELSKEDRAKTDAWLKEYETLFSENPKYIHIREWVDEVRRLSVSDQLNPSNETKQKLLEYGWNPNFPYTDVFREKVFERIQKKGIHLFKVRLFPKIRAYKFDIDEEGNILIKESKKKDLDYHKFYNDAHRLGESYKDANNTDGLKLILVMMWYLTLRTDDDIRSENFKRYKRKELVDIKARAINDFKRYHKIVLDEDKTFNFVDFFERSEYSDSINIKKSTILHTYDLIKTLTLK